MAIAATSVYSIYVLIKCLLIPALLNRLDFKIPRLVFLYTAGIWESVSLNSFPEASVVNPYVVPGAIIGDGDHKRAPFLVLGLAPWYGTIFLFLEQIVPSPVTHARTCCEDFCGCRAGKMASEIPEIFYTFGPLLNTFMSVGILPKYFRRKLLQFEWRETVSNLGMSRFISLTRLCSAASFTRTSYYSTLYFIYLED